MLLIIVGFWNRSDNGNIYNGSYMLRSLGFFFLTDKEGMLWVVMWKGVAGEGRSFCIFCLIVLFCIVKKCCYVIIVMLEMVWV